MSDSIIDTTKMSEGQRAALELAESSRDTREFSGFAASLFDGAPDFSIIFPFPTQSPEDREKGDAFLGRLKAFLASKRPQALALSCASSAPFSARRAVRGRWGRVCQQ